MKTNRINFSASGIPFLILIVLAMMGAGCTTIKEGFTGTEKEDMTPFAQKTIEVLGVGNIQLRDDELIYLRFYVDDTFVQLDKLQDRLNITEYFRDRVIAYSVELVRITEQFDTEEDKVAAYADSIEEQFRKQVIEVLGISAQEWDSVVADVRRQDNLLDALRTVQPIVHRASDFYEEVLSEIEEEILVEVRAEFDKRIMADFESILLGYERLYLRRNEIIDSLIMIDDYFRGDEGAIDRLRSSGFIFDDALLPQGSLNKQQLIALEAGLRQELIDATAMVGLLEQDRTDYMATRAELDRTEADVMAGMGLARMQILTWARAHQALAAGVKDPGSWMELSVKAAKLVGKAL
jgi:hypothetical protein